MVYYNFLDAVEAASKLSDLSISPVMQDEEGYDYWYIHQ